MVRDTVTACCILAECTWLLIGGGDVRNLLYGIMQVLTLACSSEAETCASFC